MSNNGYQTKLAQSIFSDQLTQQPADIFLVNFSFIAQSLNPHYLLRLRFQKWTAQCLQS